MFLLFWIVSLKKSLTKRLKLGPATSPAENDQCFIYKGLWIKNWFVYLKKKKTPKSHVSYLPQIVFKIL